MWIFHAVVWTESRIQIESLNGIERPKGKRFGDGTVIFDIYWVLNIVRHWLPHFVLSTYQYSTSDQTRYCRRRCCSSNGDFWIDACIPSRRRKKKLFQQLVWLPHYKFLRRQEWLRRRKSQNLLILSSVNSTNGPPIDERALDTHFTS